MNKFSLYCWEGYEVREILGKFAESRGLHVESENLTSDSRGVIKGDFGESQKPVDTEYQQPISAQKTLPGKTNSRP